MRMHSYEELTKLKTKLVEAIAQADLLVEDLGKVGCGKSFEATGAALVDQLSTISVYGEILSQYSNEWAQQLAMEVVLDAENFELVAEALKQSPS